MLHKETDIEKVKFIMSVANALHRYGASSDRIERALRLISTKLKVEAEFMSTPTSITANYIFEDNRELTSIKRMEPGKINLEKLSSSDEIVDLVLEENMSISDGKNKLKNILKRDALYKNLYVNLALALLAFGAAIFLKGSYQDAIFSGITSLILSICTQSIKKEKISTILEAIVAFVVTFVALSIHKVGIEIFPPVAILSILLFYIPGLMLTMAIHELSSENLIAGTSRLTGALIILLKLASGTYLGTQVSTFFFGAHGPSAPIPLNSYYQLASIVFVSFALCIAFQAQKKNFLWIILGCLISFYSSKSLQFHLGLIPAAFISGLIVGSGSNLFAIIFKRPAMILSLPMIILLVPGSIGYNGLGFFFQNNPLVAINTIFTTVSIGLALVAGSFFGNIVVPPKRTL